MAGIGLIGIIVLLLVAVMVIMFALAFAKNRKGGM